LSSSVSPPVLVSYAVTRRCNLKCPHCYSEALETPHPKELTTEEAKQLISEIAELGTRMIIFDGGEPTLREDLPELIKHAYDVGLTPLLGTNGMVDTLSKSYARKLKEAGLKAVAISLDGANPKTHDSFRGMEGAWQKTIEGTKNCREVGLTFQIGVAVHRKNLSEFPAIVDLAKRLGANAVEVFEFLPSGRGGKYREEYYLTNEERRELIRYIIKRQLTEDEIYFRVIGIPQYWVEVERTVTDEEALLKFVRSCCGAGTRYATILYEGTVYPCMLLQIPLGNVREESFIDIWRKNEFLKKFRNSDNLKGKCKECKYRDVCRGSRCRAFVETGDPFAEDPACWYSLDEVKG